MTECGEEFDITKSCDESAIRILFSLKKDTTTLIQEYWNQPEEESLSSVPRQYQTEFNNAKQSKEKIQLCREYLYEYPDSALSGHLGFWEKCLRIVQMDDLRQKYAHHETNRREKVNICCEMFQIDDSSDKQLYPDRGFYNHVRRIAVCMDKCRDVSKILKFQDTLERYHCEICGSDKSVTKKTDPSVVRSGPRKRIRKKDPAVKTYFTPGNTDVLLGRGGRTNNSAGNLAYRQLILDSQPIYQRLKDSDAKKEYSTTFLGNYLKNSNARFLKKDDKGWYEVSHEEARLKVSQALREDWSRDVKKTKSQMTHNNASNIANVQNTLGDVITNS
ncbi:hypothetical protein IV203_010846 [Nitzschia inconspicua]|uniref:DUF6824 domain-containing protein n=1 Tax=Nitzschia inconspicua TaxID=303405 RepID=A0A9K3KXK8_9STRA|nr:hypothetical protein IV203_010846 [Nitzschia inconspicua]